MAKQPTGPKPPKKDEKNNAPRVQASADTEVAKDSLINSRLGIPFDKDGKILLDNMRESSRDKLKALLSDAKLAKELGIVDAPAASVAPGLPPEFMFPLIHGLSILDTLIVARATNAPREIVERIAPYTEKEAALIAPPLAKVLGKYTGSWLDKYQDELALAMILGTTTLGKIAAVRDEMGRRGPARIIPITEVPPAPPVADAPPADGPQS